MSLLKELITLKKMVEGPEEDWYDMAHDPIALANKRAEDLAKAIPGAEITDKADYDQDAEVKINDKVSVQVSIDNTYSIVTKIDGKLKFSSPIRSMKEVVAKLKTTEGRMIKDPKSSDPYLRNGYPDGREQYLKALAQDYDVPLKKVKQLADMLGPDEDFDGLVVAVNDLSDPGA